MSALGCGMAAIAVVFGALGGAHIVLACGCARDRMWDFSTIAALLGIVSLGLTAMTIWAALTEGIWKL
ncbi:hypothetical protein Rhe02_54700 [Rhizocola hellebori]|uniref:Uncharacterized protein n=1 Tax=Rhizocola hellebori TaxID=1392758 RepID=A0A8J3QCX5_9ACTN|nr:hypothetical protein [Rhizocola hellebori]GIH07403.1 hypothetical protein Rhe02_54700 [Rhizocola hellebori]